MPLRPGPFEVRSTMSEIARECINVSDEFWHAYDRDDFEEAGRVLGEDITSGSHHAATEGCDDSFMEQHIDKYASEDATVHESSVEFYNVDWDEGRPTGTLFGTFSEFIHRGCRDFDYQGRPGFTLKFGVEGTIPGVRYVWVEVLANAPHFSHE